MSKKCFWVSEELPSDGQRSEIWNYHGVTEIIEDVFKEMLSRKEELEGQAVCRLHGKQIKIFYRVLRMFSV